MTAAAQGSEAPSTQSTASDDALVFVDLDRCLLSDDSIGMLVTRLIDRGMAPRTALLRGAFGYLAYRLNWVHPGQMIRRGIRTLTDRPEAPLRAEAEALFHEVAKFRYRPRMVDEIREHQRAGRPVYLLTGNLPYLPELVAGDLKLDGVHSTRAEVRDGTFTGRVLQPPCAGEGKIVHAQRTAEHTGRLLSASWFYTDSYSDLPMLLVCGNPVAVNPDRKLQKLAKKQRWRVLH